MGGVLRDRTDLQSCGIKVLQSQAVLVHHHHVAVLLWRSKVLNTTVQAIIFVPEELGNVDVVRMSVNVLSQGMELVARLNAYLSCFEVATTTWDALGLARED